MQTSVYVKVHTPGPPVVWTEGARGKAQHSCHFLTACQSKSLTAFFKKTRCLWSPAFCRTSSQTCQHQFYLHQLSRHITSKNTTSMFIWVTRLNGFRGQLEDDEQTTSGPETKAALWNSPEVRSRPVFPVVTQNNWFLISVPWSFQMTNDEWMNVNFKSFHKNSSNSLKAELIYLHTSGTPDMFLSASVNNRSQSPDLCSRHRNLMVSAR